MFELVGETLRRLRKERHMTLAQLGQKAGLGRGQLSRIENGHQEATLTTLAKILASQSVSRRDFFRRYDFVENEAISVELAGAAESDAYPAANSAAAALPGEIRESLGRVESFMQGIFRQSQPVAQGAVEIGDHVVLFQVVPRGGAVAAELVAGAPPPPPPEPAAPARKRSRRKQR
jgi:transcriptional regulator with XRE-family HTH domain